MKEWLTANKTVTLVLAMNASGENRGNLWNKDLMPLIFVDYLLLPRVELLITNLSGWKRTPLEKGLATRSCAGEWTIHNPLNRKSVMKRVFFPWAAQAEQKSSTRASRIVQFPRSDDLWKGSGYHSSNYGEADGSTTRILLTLRNIVYLWSGNSGGELQSLLQYAWRIYGRRTTKFKVD